MQSIPNNALESQQKMRCFARKQNPVQKPEGRSKSTPVEGRRVRVYNFYKIQKIAKKSQFRIQIVSGETERWCEQNKPPANQLAAPRLENFWRPRKNLIKRLGPPIWIQPGMAWKCLLKRPRKNGIIDQGNLRWKKLEDINIQRRISSDDCLFKDWCGKSPWWWNRTTSKV